MLYTIKCFLVIYKTCVEVFIMLSAFLNYIADVENMISGTPIGPESCLCNIDLFIKFLSKSSLNNF